MEKPDFSTTCWVCCTATNSGATGFLSNVGYVHENNLVGKAKIIFFSNDTKKGSVLKDENNSFGSQRTSKGSQRKSHGSGFSGLFNAER